MWPYFDCASATQTFITCHCPQAYVNVLMLGSQNKATFSGVLRKKKKKKGDHLSGVKLGGIFSCRLFFFFGDQA